jgi:glycosyltransferase involved in cell wall biosynthesis
MDDKVSVIINCFNGDEYLRQAIESVYSQTYQNWEIIFWDNCSNDNSSSIANSFDNRLKYFFSKKKTTLSEARKLAVSKSTGKWIAFLDTDDFWFEDKLFLQMEKLKNTNFIVCYGGVNEVSESGRLIRSLVPKYPDGNQLKDHLKQFDINMVTPIIRKKALEENNINFDEKIVASEEYNIFMKLACVGEFCTINKVLGVWRIRLNSLTNQSIEFWSKDRKYTLNQLKRIMPNIEEKFPEEYSYALATADYYEARFLIDSKKYFQARQIMYKIKTYSFTFFFLWLISYVPFFWNVLHEESVKRFLSANLLRKSKTKNNN